MVSEECCKNDVLGGKKTKEKKKAKRIFEKKKKRYQLATRIRTEDSIIDSCDIILYGFVSE